MERKSVDFISKTLYLAFQHHLEKVDNNANEFLKTIESELGKEHAEFIRAATEPFFTTMEAFYGVIREVVTTASQTCVEVSVDRQEYDALVKRNQLKKMPSDMRFVGYPVTVAMATRLSLHLLSSLLFVRETFVINNKAPVQEERLRFIKLVWEHMHKDFPGSKLPFADEDIVMDRPIPDEVKHQVDEMINGIRSSSKK